MPEIALQWCVLEAYEDDVRSGIGHAIYGAKMNLLWRVGYMPSDFMNIYRMLL